MLGHKGGSCTLNLGRVVEWKETHIRSLVHPIAGTWNRNQLLQRQDTLVLLTGLSLSPRDCPRGESTRDTWIQLEKKRKITLHWRCRRGVALLDLDLHCNHGRPNLNGGLRVS